MLQLSLQEIFQFFNETFNQYYKDGDVLNDPEEIYDEFIGRFGEGSKKYILDVYSRDGWIAYIEFLVASKKS